MNFITGNILRYKTKRFPTPFNVQFMGHRGNKVELSDGRRSLEVQFSSKYSHLFTDNCLNEFDIVTINEIKRVTQFKLFVDNIRIFKDPQIGCKLGNPTPFCIPTS